MADQGLLIAGAGNALLGVVEIPAREHHPGVVARQALIEAGLAQGLWRLGGSGYGVHSEDGG
jgi:hypothetical protein